MIPSARKQYNDNFSEARYQRFLADLDRAFDLKITFRVAESPVFVSRNFKEKLLRASDEIIDFLVRPDLKALTERAIPPDLRVPQETEHTLFLALDFAVVRDEGGELQPRLIEMQGFPSLFGWQDFLAGKYREHFSIPSGFQHHADLSDGAYREKMVKAWVGSHAPEEVVLLEIDPMKQNTAIDFVITEKMSGVKAVHVGDVIREGRRLFYVRSGRRIQIRRIYNRVIFDELVKRTDLKLSFNLTEDVDVEWAGHPNWFFRISKFTMPFIRSEFIPECRFLNEYEKYPADLENYVLKPLFSFSGSGIVFHLSQADIDAIPVSARGNYLLQRKIQYEPVIQAPDGLVKTEIRLLFLWEDAKPRPAFVTNLARLSRGEMIGVKFNKDKTWVGGSVCFFEA